MEKQLAFFEVEKKDNFSVWSSMPEKMRQKIESIFANLLTKHINPSLKEVNENEKGQ